MSAEQLRPGWRRVKFGDVVRQVKDKVDPESAGIERYVAGEHMDTDDLRIRRWGEVGDGYLGPAFTMRFQPGQVLYGSRRTYLRKVALADFEGICANTTFVVQSAADDLLPEFLPYVMTAQAFHEHSIKQSKGSVNPYINFSDLKWYEFALPPLDEQREAVKVLSQFSVAERCYEEVAGARVELLNAKVAGSVAKGEVSLGELLEEPPRNGLTISVASSPQDFRALTLSSVDFDGYRGDGFKWISNEDVAGCVAEPGDLFITRSNTIERVGLPFIFPGADGPVVYSDLMMRLRVKRHLMNPVVLEAFLRSLPARKYIRSIAAGTSASMKKINARNLMRMPVPLLSDEEQERAAKALRKLSAFAAAERGAAESLKTARGAVQERLLAGEY